MNCKYSENDIALYVEGDVSNALSHEIQAHLTACAGCHELAASLRESQAIFKTLRQDTAGSAALSAVRARVIDEISSSRSRWPWGRWIYAMAGAGLAVVVGVLLMLDRSRVEPVQQVWVSESQQPVAAAPRPSSPVKQSVKQDVATVPVPNAHARRKRRSAVHTEKRVDSPPAQTLVVKLFTDDPNIVIYWLVDQKDGGAL
jgi:anti-sigma factor RsiW